VVVLKTCCGSPDFNGVQEGSPPAIIASMGSTLCPMVIVLSLYLRFGKAVNPLGLTASDAWTNACPQEILDSINHDFAKRFSIEKDSGVD
jgi:hypothetical protein